MTDPFHPHPTDGPLLEAFAGLLRSAHEAVLASGDGPAFSEALDRHDHDRRTVYLTPPRTGAGALAKVLALMDPSLGLEAGARGDAADLVCVAQLGAFLAGFGGTVERLRARCGGDAERLLAAALAVTFDAAAGDLSARSWFPEELGGEVVR